MEKSKKGFYPLNEEGRNETENGSIGKLIKMWKKDEK